MMSRMKKLLENKTAQESLLFATLAVLLLVCGLHGQYSGGKIPWMLSPYLFPTAIALLLLLLSASLWMEAVRGRASESGSEPTGKKQNLRGALAVAGGVAVYCVAMPAVGFLLSTTVFLAVLITCLGERRWPLIAAISVACAAVCYLIFAVLLNVMLP